MTALRRSPRLIGEEDEDDDDDEEEEEEAEEDDDEDDEEDDEAPPLHPSQSSHETHPSSLYRAAGVPEILEGHSPLAR